MRGTALAAAACLVTACLAGACSSAAATASGASSGAGSGAGSDTAPIIASTSGEAAASHPSAAWPTFGRTAARTGAAAVLSKAGKLSRKWTARLDGAVYGQPLVVGSYVIAATENDTIYELRQSTGAVVWHSHLATPVPQADLNGCGDIFPLGITGTPVYDQSNGLVYAVAEALVNGHVTHEMFGVAESNGAVKVRRDLPMPGGNDSYYQQRPALTLDDGRVFADFGGLAGDCGPYVGTVIGVPVSGGGSLATWRVPTSRQGGIWAVGGPVVGPDNDLWISIGNSANGPGRPYDGGDSVTRLTLSKTGTLSRRNFFAPLTWATDNASDLDLGSSTPVLAADNSAFIMGKSGTGYLLETTSLGGVSAGRAAQAICKAFGAGAVSGSVVYEPCTTGGMAAISVNAAKRTIRVLWRGPSGAAGSPSVGGGAIWVPDSTGILYELNPANGAVRSQVSLGASLPRFSSVSLGGGKAYVGTLDGVVAVSGA